MEQNVFGLICQIKEPVAWNQRHRAWRFLLGLQQCCVWLGLFENRL